MFVTYFGCFVIWLYLIVCLPLYCCLLFPVVEFVYLLLVCYSCCYYFLFVWFVFNVFVVNLFALRITCC